MDQIYLTHGIAYATKTTLGEGVKTQAIDTLVPYLPCRVFIGERFTFRDLWRLITTDEMDRSVYNVIMNRTLRGNALRDFMGDLDGKPDAGCQALRIQVEAELERDDSGGWRMQIVHDLLLRCDSKGEESLFALDYLPLSAYADLPMELVTTFNLGYLTWPGDSDHVSPQDPETRVLAHNVQFEGLRVWDLISAVLNMVTAHGPPAFRDRAKHEAEVQVL